MTDFNNGMAERTEKTDMMVNYLANSEKMIAANERWHPNKNNNDDDIDEKFDTYVTNNDNTYNGNNDINNNHENFNNNDTRVSVL